MKYNRYGEKLAGTHTLERNIIEWVILKDEMQPEKIRETAEKVHAEIFPPEYSKELSDQITNDIINKMFM